MNYILAVLSALLLILIFPRFDFVWLAPVALCPLLIAVTRERRAGPRFLLGYLAGALYWCGVCYWIGGVLAKFGGISSVLAWLLLALFCLVKALHMGFFALLAGMAMRTAWAVPAVAALWVAIEITHGWLGFAWLALGNAGIDMGIPMRLSPYTGVYGVSFVFMMMATALALALLRRPRRQLLWVVALPLLMLLPRLPDLHRGNQIAILTQPNISETETWTPQTVQAMERRLLYLSMNAVLADKHQSADLVVWPEVPAPLYADDPEFLRMAAKLSRPAGAYFLTGVVGHTPDGAPLNSALLVSPSGDVVGRYDKVNLVPFGEFVPWPFGFVNKISTEAGDFQAGKKLVVFPMGEHRMSAFICYESVFPDFVRQFVLNGAELLVNISNDSWFGKSPARLQHLKIVRMRAAENRRWILRSTNDGITGTIDPAGRLLGTLPDYMEAASRSGYSYIKETTFYTRHGDWFALICAVFGVGTVAWVRWKST